MIALSLGEQIDYNYDYESDEEVEEISRRWECSCYTSTTIEVEALDKESAEAEAANQAEQDCLVDWECECKEI